MSTSVTPSPSSGALERLDARLARIEAMLEAQHDLTRQALPMLAMMGDIVDDRVARAAERGLAPDRALANAAEALGQLVRLVQSDAFADFLQAGALEPRNLDALTELVVAVRETRQEPPGRTGLFGLFKATRRASTQRLMHFAVRLTERLGGRPRAVTDTTSSPQDRP